MKICNIYCTVLSENEMICSVIENTNGGPGIIGPSYFYMISPGTVFSFIHLLITTFFANLCEFLQGKYTI
jgi:hypothetical protein